MNIALIEPLGIKEENILKFKNLVEALNHTFTYYNTKPKDENDLITHGWTGLAPRAGKTARTRPARQLRTLPKNSSTCIRAARHPGAFPFPRMPSGRLPLRRPFPTPRRKTS